MELQRPPLSQKIIFALGQLGWSLASFGAANLLVYFYMPPETEQAALFPTFIFQGAILGSLTLIGIINFGGRIFDAITDPLIAQWSDRMQHPIGKRKIWLAVTGVPLAVFAFLVFFPLGNTPGWGNHLWLSFTILMFYLCLTLYVVPYSALISELGHFSKDRLLISTLISIAWAVGFLIGSNAYALQALFEQASYPPTRAFQMAMAIFAGIALVFLYVPVFFLQENQFAYQKPLHLDLRKALGNVLANRNFRTFIFSDLVYWLSLTFIQLGVGFYVTTIFGFEKEHATLFLTISFLVSFLFYVPVNMLAGRVGKKQVILAGFLVFCLVFMLTALFPTLKLSATLVFYLLAIASSFPLAAFGIIPNAIIADLVYQHEQNTGIQQAGMFFATRNFTMKMGISLANLIFPSLLLFGKSTANNTGVLATAWVAAAFCLIGFLIFLRFREVQ
jgi:GPH family glycoside/pentoside/hexuronide:cation symporter